MNFSIIVLCISELNELLIYNPRYKNEEFKIQLRYVF